MDDFVHVSTGPSARPAPWRSVGEDFLANTKAERMFTEGFIVESLRRHHPKHHMSVTPTYNTDLLAFAAAHDDVTCTPHGDPENAVKERVFRPPQRRYNDDDDGAFEDVVQFAAYDYAFKGQQYLLYVVRGNDGPFGTTTINYVLAEDVTKGAAQSKADDLIRTATKWGLELHNEVLVFDQGWWQPNADLWRNVQ